MKVLDVLTAPWAIQPEKLLEIQAIYAGHLRGDKVDIAAVEQRLGRPLANEAKAYDIIDGVAVLPLHGVIAKRMNLMTQISGGVSTELAARSLQDAIADPAVHSIILSIDSPGGTVDGTQALADQVRAVRDRKPVVTLASGTMASAAYWIGSSAAQAYIADGTTQVGSIGVVAAHQDVSGAETQRGIKTTEIVAGKFKRVASAYAPLTEAGRATMQEQVDYLYGVFVQAVASNRGVTAEKVVQDMADGRVFIGQQAIAAGLVDGVTTLDALVADLNRRQASAGVNTSTKGASMASNTISMKIAANDPEVLARGREVLAAEAPDLLATILAEGRAAGAEAERARIQAVEGQSMPGHDALIASLKFDGKTTGPEAAVAVLQAERATRGRAAQQLRDEAPQPVPMGATPAIEMREPAEPDMSLPVEERCQAQWATQAATRKEFSSLAAYTAFVRASESGAARIMNKQGA